MPDGELGVLPTGQSAGRDERGRWLVPPPGNAARFQPGQSGNPTGLGNAYRQAIVDARKRSPAMVARMVELAELDNVDQDGKLSPLSRKTDPRVAIQAVDWLWVTAWGKDHASKASMIDTDKPGITIEQRRDEAMQTLQAAFERVLQASRAQEAEAGAIVIEPGE